MIAALANGPLSKSGIARMLGQKAVSGQLKKTIALLLAQGHIEFTIPEKPGSRLQRYRLTANTRTGHSGEERP